MGRLLFLAAAFCIPPQAQTLEDLRFLQGQWTDASDRAAVTEFHWLNKGDTTYFVGRRWNGSLTPNCPWCTAQSAMVAKYDSDLRRVVLHYADKANYSLEFRLIQAQPKFLQFETPVESGAPVYRLTFSLSLQGTLSQTLERSDSIEAGIFVQVSAVSLRQLVLYDFHAGGPVSPQVHRRS